MATTATMVSDVGALIQTLCSPCYAFAHTRSPVRSPHTSPRPGRSMREVYAHMAGLSGRGDSLSSGKWHAHPIPHVLAPSLPHLTMPCHRIDTIV